MSEHPQQPTYLDDSGVLRFRENKIINWLWESGAIDLNKIAMRCFPEEDQRQFAQLLGYSVGGYNDLSYVEGHEVDY